ncbi:MAG: type IV pili methyl-accepting chemotaxis transducer N-terminal domain-containing protein [Gammaproteobacteria bacterium]|nr:type IV pili methyl-accepting chemotaxis transducer N-terminal domain-containing protein [Gammaproteobacteria bacterium]
MAEIQKRSNRALYLLLILAFMLIGLAIWDLVAVASNSTRDSEFLSLNAQQSLISQTLARSSELAVAGNDDAFKDLRKASDQFDTSMKLMVSGDPKTLMPAATGEILSELNVLQGQWAQARTAAQTILSAHDSILAANQAAAGINQAMPGLIQSWNNLTNQLAKSGTGRNAVVYAAKQGYYGQLIQRDVNLLVTGGHGDTAFVAKELPDSIQSYTRITRAMLDGDSQLGITAITDPGLLAPLRSINEQFSKLNNNLNSIAPLLNLLVNVQTADQAIHALSDQMLTTTQAINNSYTQQVSGSMFRPIVAYVLGAIGLLLLLFILWIYVLGGDARRTANMQRDQNERNQQAILRLLDELGSLADGDLTVQATVSEDITGAIADSINYALEALRGLVRTINDTAVQVDAAARQTQATATHLAEASKNQSKQINTASTSITQMAHSIEQVSLNADRSSKVAQQSVDIAHKGGEAVRRTIDGMNNIRETIQETSKRIKRLGESSQEIGDIVELINDIAEQTNILALNAAIQASMAGEAGRGFAVVADEVQRLAERSANATRQIEALVKTIQTDTNEAVISMEQSTAGVVSGAQLAENAGTSLDEIEKVANNIATLVQSISSSARQQAQTAGEMTRTMNVIREITAQTTEGTMTTAQSIGKLAALATEMRKSVSGFKLPGGSNQETMIIVPSPPMQGDVA